jgi:hypothetical protein
VGSLYWSKAPSAGGLKAKHFGPGHTKAQARFAAV